MDPTQLIEWGGFIIIAILIFAETGFLLGLVIPGGETLLFTSGLLVSTDTLKVPIIILTGTLVFAGILGDLSGFMIGKKLGRGLYEKKDTWYFKKKYLQMTEDFYLKHKRSSLIVGKFLPVIRPFNPVISGITKMPFAIFIGASSLACILYMSSFILIGYFLGGKFPFIKDYLGWIIPISIVVALIPVIIQFRKMRSQS
jgi:membrane-associated protein